MIVKFALRNLCRLPWRSLLYFAIVFFMIAAMTVSLFIYGACLDAKNALDQNYIFVASLVQREKETIALSDIAYCLNDNGRGYSRRGNDVSYAERNRSG